MSLNKDPWPQEVLYELNLSTRSLLFDWDRVATHLAAFVKGKHSLVISAQICREKFAEFNSEHPFSNHNKMSDISVISAHERGVRDGGERSTTSMYEQMSLEELIETVDRNEREMKLKKEQIFQRVLNCLGEFEYDRSQVMLEDPAISAYQHALSKRIEGHRLQILKNEELLEKERLERERESLRRRFDPDSEDCIGENPEIFVKDGDVADLKTEETSHLANTFSMQNFIEGEEFERVLSELEKELDSHAMEKSETISELGEVIQFLERKEIHEDYAKRENDLATIVFEESRKLAQLYSDALKASSHVESVDLPQPPSSKANLQICSELKESTATNYSNNAAIVPKKSSRNSSNIDHPAEENQFNDDSDPDSDDINIMWRKKRAEVKARSGVPQSILLAEEKGFRVAKALDISILEGNESIAEENCAKTTRDEISLQENLPVKEELPVSYPPETSLIASGGDPEVFEKTISFLEEIIPVISTEYIPNTSGSLLSGGIARKEKGKKKQ